MLGFVGNTLTARRQGTLRRISVVMVGPFPRTDSVRGISALLNTYFRYVPFEEFDTYYVSTSSRGHWGSKAWSFVAAFPKIAIYRASRNARIVHLHSASYGSFPRKALIAWFSLAILRARVVFHVHGGRFMEYYSSRSPIGRRMIKWILDRVDVIVVLSESWKEKVAGITQNRSIEVVHNAVDGRHLRPVGGEIFEQPPAILFLNVLHEDKGIYDFLKAASLVSDLRPGTKFVVCGTGELNRCMELSDSLGISSHVSFRGWVAGKDKESAFRNASMFVLPSRYEGLPISLIEAMYAELPVIATAVGGIPDIIRPGTNGFLVPVGDVEALARSMLELIGNGELAKQMGRSNGQAASRLFDVDVVGRKLCLIYRGLLSAAS